MRIELENVDTGQRMMVLTDVSGTYTFGNVPPGKYRIIITRAANSAPAPTQEFEVNAGRTSTVHISLPSGPGADVQAETNEVAVSTKPAMMFDVWNTRFVTYLPRPNFISRQGEANGAYNLALLTSGTVSRLPEWPGGVAFSGQRPDTNLFHLDGADNRNLLTGGPLAYLSNEATTEFALMQNQPNPLFGHSGGAKLNSIIRSGTNQWHGSVYDYLQNKWFNAIDRSFTPFGFNEDNQPRFDQNRLGGTLGMPVLPGKIFFFGNFEYIPLGFRAPTGGFVTAPTQAGFETLAARSNVSATNLGILQSALAGGAPETATDTRTIAGVSVPVGFVNNVQNLWQNQRNGTGSMDFHITDNDQVRLRYVHNEIDRNFSGGALAGRQNSSFNRSLMANLGYYRTLGLGAVNELRLGYNRNTSEQYFNGTAGPAINILGGFNLNLGPTFLPAGIANTYHLADNVNFRFGPHQFSAGIDFRRFLGFRTNFPQFNGNYAYSSLGRFLMDQPPDVVSERAFGNNRFDLGQWLYFGYIQDHWRVSPNLTLDLGLRYQYAKVPRAFRNQALNTISNVPDVLTFNEPADDRTNFAPFFGIAYSPWQNNTVLRAGFGMYYDATFQMPFLLGFAPQVSRVVTGNLNAAGAGFLGAGGLQDTLTGDTLSDTAARRSVTAFVPDQKLPYSMQWNAAIQQTIWRNTTAEIRYMGSRGVNLPFFNQLNYNGVTPSMNLPLFDTAPAQSTLNALPLTLTTLQSQQNDFTGAGFTSPITALNYGGNSWYNAFTFQLNHGFAGGLQVIGNYTWSRWEDDVTGTPMDIGLPQRERSWSMFDRRHQANVTGMFELAPLFRDTGSMVRNVFADFNIAATYNYAIGGRLTPVTGINNALANNSLGTPAIVNPAVNNLDVSGLAPLRNTQGNIVAYQVQNPQARFIEGAPGVFSGFNRGGVNLRDLHNVNAAAVKRFNYRERASFEIRGEAYNLFNRPQPGVSSLQTFNTGFVPLGAVAGTIPLSGISNLAILPSNPRTLQLALRLTF